MTVSLSVGLFTRFIYRISFNLQIKSFCYKCLSSRLATPEPPASGTGAGAGRRDRDRRQPGRPGRAGSRHTRDGSAARITASLQPLHRTPDSERSQSRLAASIPLYGWLHAAAAAAQGGFARPRGGGRARPLLLSRSPARPRTRTRPSASAPDPKGTRLPSSRT